MSLTPGNKRWETRRKLYGTKGHLCAYRCGILTNKPNTRGMLNLIIKLHREEVLSEGQVAHATGLGRIEIRDLVIAQGGYKS